MTTFHKILFQDAQCLQDIPTSSVDLVVTSPPYPMIAMWDDAFSSQNPSIKESLNVGSGENAFNLMHEILDQVWDELFRVLKTGSFACINIGDATRKIGNEFRLYPNHARIINYLSGLGFSILPDILWRKQTNAPNKFLGSGMLPAGAYITLEHEYILIVRKGVKREFNSAEEKRNRYESALFWEERNIWYSDVWMDIKGNRQNHNNNSVRERSASFPFELAYRLINMYSVKGDVVLDPFVGTGTTMAAAVVSERNSLGVEIDEQFYQSISEQIRKVEDANSFQVQRLKNHLQFVGECIRNDKQLKYMNKHHVFPVKTSQEVDILFRLVQSVQEVSTGYYEVDYSNIPQWNFDRSQHSLMHETEHAS